MTPDVALRLLFAMRKGTTYEMAAQFAGIHYATYRRWMLRGAPECDGRYAELVDAVRMAEGVAAVNWLGNIKHAADRDWRAANGC